MSSNRSRFNIARATVGLCCKDCTKRHPGCHDSCEDYKKAISEHRRSKSNVQKTKQFESEWIRYVKENNR